MSRKERLSAYLKGFGKSESGVVVNSIYIGKELFNLQFDGPKSDYKFRISDAYQLSCPDTSIDLRLLEKNPINPKIDGDLNKFLNVGKFLSKYNPREIAFIAQMLWNNGSHLNAKERKEAIKLLKKIRSTHINP